MSDSLIGISGWTYGPWRGVFYPKGLPHARELEYASRRLPTIELNGTFYRLQRPSTFEKWHGDTPEGFVFAVKAPRYISHIRRLREVEKPVANFLASGIFALKEKLGPILWQFPPNMKFDPSVFERFLNLLPHDTETAAQVAASHDAWMRDRVDLEPGEPRPLRHAVEVRNESFVTAAFVELLRAYRVALVFSHSPNVWPYFEDVTTDFVYARLHGKSELYTGSYGDESLEEWAEKIRLWRSGREPRDAVRASPARPIRHARDVYVYFDNDVKVAAPADAIALAHKLAPVVRRTRVRRA